MRSFEFAANTGGKIDFKPAGSAVQGFLFQKFLPWLRQRGIQNHSSAICNTNLKHPQRYVFTAIEPTAFIPTGFEPRCFDRGEDAFAAAGKKTALYR